MNKEDMPLELINTKIPQRIQDRFQITHDQDWVYLSTKETGTPVIKISWIALREYSGEVLNNQWDALEYKKKYRKNREKKEEATS